MKFPIYLDYSATTPVDPRVVDKMIPFLYENFGNAASTSHEYGWKAKEAVENARAEVAALINADPKEIVWTSGATESDNLAIKGAARFHKDKGKHLITVKTEHKAVLDSMRELEREGMKFPIYLDYSATTPVDPRVVDKMIPFLYENFGNAASTSHEYGWKAKEAVENARAEVAALINADPKEIVWTSGATESDNLAIKGAARFHKDKGKHLITVKTEHKAVLDSMRELEREGFEVTYMDVGKDGLLDLDALAKAMRPDTTLVSVMAVNNEIGVIQDIEKIGEMCRERGILFHVDATQAAGKISLDMEKLKVDLMSLSAHKLYGPKGMGALYVRRKPRARIEAIIHGGGHERGMRSGTLATHQIVGMGEAYRLCRLEMDEEMKRIGALRDRLWKGLSEIEAVHVNGSMEHRAPFNLNVSFAFVEGEALMASCPEIAVSSGSACTSASLEPSYVLRALGIDDELAHSSIRFSLGRFTTEEEIDYTVKLIKEKVAQLREMSPLWEMYKEGVDMKQVKWTEH